MLQLYKYCKKATTGFHTFPLLSGKVIIHAFSKSSNIFTLKMRKAQFDFPDAFKYILNTVNFT